MKVWQPVFMIEEILEKVDAVDPVRYGRTRNFLNGDVTRLSPYISRGVISTKMVLEKVLDKNYEPARIEKFLKELAWRDYFQNVWLNKNIDEAIKQPQSDVRNYSMPKAVLHAQTGIDAVDRGINDLYSTGYVHNHLRMYIASVVTNVAKCDWKIPAKWFYYHLLDADWASNACSWQWTCGAFSSKKYVANQENINKYCSTDQQGTFLDIDYSGFSELPIPEILQETELPELITTLPPKRNIEIDSSLPTCIYNFYNLDPLWKNGIPRNSVLLLEPSHFERYPVSDKSIEFVLKLAGSIERIQVFVGEFSDLRREYGISEIFFKEHPTNSHYQGVKEERDWMFPEVRGYFPSFFAYWKQCEKVLKRDFGMELLSSR